MTTKIVDIADEIYRELGEPLDISIASIAYWLRTNLPNLNILIDKKYSIGSDLEVSGSELEPFTLNEKNIFKKMFIVFYYERLFRNSLGAASVDSVVSVTDDGSTVVKINKNEIAKNYSNLKLQAKEELNELITSYSLHGVSPIQVAGDDTIPGNIDTNDNNIYTRGI
ncbi:MAG: hypothetical protein EBU90_08255 [Proteobacteria bacterium]|nr:hypothetical protein [Pseudomonadota bacterium]NBP15632.1 hypothetical protein [bacterium]